MIFNLEKILEMLKIEIKTYDNLQKFYINKIKFITYNFFFD